MITEQQTKPLDYSFILAIFMYIGLPLVFLAVILKKYYFNIVENNFVNDDVVMNLQAQPLTPSIHPQQVIEENKVNKDPLIKKLSFSSKHSEEEKTDIISSPIATNQSQETNNTNAEQPNHKDYYKEIFVFGTMFLVALGLHKSETKKKDNKKKENTPESEQTQDNRNSSYIPRIK